MVNRSEEERLNLYHISIICALLAFAASSALYLHSFASHKTQVSLHRVAFGLFTLAALLMTANSVAAYMYGVPIATTSFVLIAATAWITVLGQLFFGVQVLGGLVAPLSTLILLIQFFFVSHHSQATVGDSPTGLMAAHILTSVLGEAFSIIAFAIAVFYLLQQRALKQKQLDRLQHTQISISKLNQALIVSIWIGFLLLTCGLILGAIYSQFYYQGERSELLGKIIWAFMVWLWYLATLSSRNIFNFSAKRLAWMTIFGFILLALGLFGINNWSYFVG